MSLRSLAAWKKPLAVSLIVLTAVVNLVQFAPLVLAQGGDRAADAASALIGGDRISDAAALSDAGARDAEVVSEALSTSDACAGGDSISGQFLGFLCTGITTILGWIVELLGKLVLLIISVLLAFARYNGFSNAAVVQVGWPIVRDICNMFFIVILLVSAFSTIIDYGGGELHYTKVLPKLLLMAVLINFSKTLIQLLIDFSQVVMLTFVNAFIASGTGNFVNALGLQDVMQIAENGVPTGAATMANVIISYMLAIFMLGIMVSVVSILTGFIIFRIVGLWIALILSPLAFFATAVPGKLAKGLGSISSDYWTRLGSLLSGGPIIAFFLWLTLAVVQQANSGAAGAGLSQVLDFEVEGDLQVFLTSVGNAQSIASFIVGITLLMMGLDQAVKSANSIGSTLLSTFAQRAKGAGMSLGRLGALAPFLAAGYGVRAGARAGYRAVDQRLDLTRKVSTAGLQATNALANAPVVGALGGRALRTAARPTLAKGLTMRREEAAREADEEKRLLRNVDKFATDEELKLVGGAQSFGASKFRTLGARAASMTAAEVLSSDGIRDRESKRNEAAYVNRLQASGMSEADAKSGSKVLAEKDAQREQTDFVQKRLELARTAGDRDTIEALEKAINASPMLASEEKRDKVIEDLAKDPDKYKDISKMDSMSGQVLTGFMLQHGYESDKTTGALVLKDAAAYDSLKDAVEASGNKALQQGLEAHEVFVANSPGITVDKAKTLQHRRNAANGTMQSFDVSMEKGAWKTTKNPAGDQVLQAGSRVFTDNYMKAERGLGEMTELRKKGVDIAPAENVRLAKQFINNNGTLADYISKAQTSETDAVPIETLRTEIYAGARNAQAALAAGDTRKANDDIKVTAKILAQINAPKIDAAKQVQLISAVSNGLKGSGTTIDASFIRDINRLHPDARDAMVKTIETTKKRADDILRDLAPGAVASAEQQAVLDLSDAISKEIDKNKKNISARILNAYRPGRDRNT